MRRKWRNCEHHSPAIMRRFCESGAVSQFSPTVPLAARTVACVVQIMYILMYRINCGQAPKYITDLVSTVAATATRSGLRSENTTNYCLPRLWTKFVERAFSYAEPAAWNRLPQNIRASTSLNVFKRKLIRHIYLQKLLTEPINILLF